MTVQMRITVDLTVPRSSLDATIAIVSIRNGVVMVLWIAVIIQMKKVMKNLPMTNGGGGAKVGLWG